MALVKKLLMYLKGTWGQKITAAFMAFHGKESYTKLCHVLISSHKVIKLQRIETAQNISSLVFVDFMEKEVFTQC